MAVAESFLRDGSPWASTEALHEAYGTRGVAPYAAWHCVAVFVRRWCTDLRIASYVCPGYVLFFGLASTADGGSDDGDASLLRLFSYAPVHLKAVEPRSAVDVAQLAMRAVAETHRAVPEGCRPAHGATVGVHVPASIEGVGLMVAQEVRHHLQTAVAARQEMVCLVQQRPVASPERIAVIEAAATWCTNQDPALVATELPRNPNLGAFLNALYPDGDAEAATATTTPAGAANMMLPLCTSTVPHAAEVLHKAPAAWCGVSLPPLQPPPSCSTSTTQPSWRHAALVQRRTTDRTTSSDGIITGPTQPCTPGPTFHLHHDSGDVRFAQRAIMDSRIPAACYDDLLPLDGEVCLEVGWVEGMPFDDIDVALAFFSERRRSTTAASSCHADGTRSVYPWLVPRVAYRTPTGTVRRRTPVEDPTMQVTEGQPSEEMLHDALRMLEWYIANATVATDVTPSTGGQGGARLGIVLPPACTEAVRLETPATHMTCSWCGRERAKLLRCGGCRVSCYCCKQHQQLDWKGSHKGECAKWGESAKQYDSLVKPLLATRSAAPPKNIAEPASVVALQAAAADADTLVAMLSLMNIRVAERQQRDPSSPCPRHVLLHVLQFDGDADVWMQSMCDEARQAQVWKILHEAAGAAGSAVTQLRIVVCSPTVPASHRNAVYGLSTAHGVRCAPSTGTVGDLWHEHAPPQSNPDTTVPEGNAKEPLILVRWYNEKYHQFLGKQADLLAPPPDAALVFGDAQGNGLSFFSAVAEVVAGEYDGVVPVAITDASLLASSRSAQGIAQRRAMCGSGTGNDAGLPSPQLNAAGFGVVPTTPPPVSAPPEDGAPPLQGATRATTSMAVVPLHRHLYYFILPTAETRHA